MDTFPAQENSTQPVPVREPSQKSLRKLFNISSWIIFFALLPITVLIFLSQDSIPGDSFYPVKRSLENVILAAASVNPATRAAFRTDLTETRFKEAQSLVVSKSNASGLFTFISEVQSTQLEVTSLKNDTEREKAEGKLAVKIQNYQNGLSALETKTQQNIIAYQFQEIPTPTSIPSESSLNLPSTIITFAPTPTLIPTSTPTPLPSAMPQSFSKSTPVPTPRPIPTLSLTQSPTLTPAPTVVPTTSQPENTQVIEQRRIAESIKDTKEKLDKIQKELEERKIHRVERRTENNKRDKNK